MFNLIADTIDDIKTDKYLARTIVVARNVSNGILESCTEDTQAHLHPWDHIVIPVPYTYFLDECDYYAEANYVAFSNKYTDLETDTLLITDYEGGLYLRLTTEVHTERQSLYLSALKDILRISEQGVMDIEFTDTFIAEREHDDWDSHGYELICEELAQLGYETDTIDDNELTTVYRDTAASLGEYPYAEIGHGTRFPRSRYLLESLANALELDKTI